MEIVSYIITNGIAVIFVFLCWRNPRVGRILFFVLFLLASCLNVYTALRSPEVYQYFARLTWFSIYRDFITGWFRNNADWFVTVIAVSQLSIAMSMWFKESMLRLGSLGAIFFFIAIAPLGLGSAFPATLIMAFAMYFIFRGADRQSTRIEKRTIFSSRR